MSGAPRIPRHCAISACVTGLTSCVAWLPSSTETTPELIKMSENDGWMLTGPVLIDVQLT